MLYQLKKHKKIPNFAIKQRKVKKQLILDISLNKNKSNKNNKNKIL
jgi:hypothetical protein